MVSKREKVSPTLKSCARQRASSLRDGGPGDSLICAVSCSTSVFWLPLMSDCTGHTHTHTHIISRWTQPLCLLPAIRTSRLACEYANMHARTPLSLSLHKHTHTHNLHFPHTSKNSPSTIRLCIPSTTTTKSTKDYYTAKAQNA